jgi:hypothetical protein
MMTFQDAGLHKLMSLLVTKSEAGAPYGRIYTDSLVHALAIRLGPVNTIRATATVVNFHGV